MNRTNQSQQLKKPGSTEPGADNDWFEELGDARWQGAGNSNLLSDIGQIQQINLPASWTERLQEGKPAGNVLFREFGPAAQSDVEFSFYYRGLRTGQRSGQSFCEILQRPPHQVSSEELEDLSQTLRNKYQDYFFLISAHTEYLAGKTVLIVEGSYHSGNPDQIDTYACYLDSDGTGTAVQEIYYQASKNNYQRYLQDARDSLKSILWK